MQRRSQRKYLYFYLCKDFYTRTLTLTTKRLTRNSDPKAALWRCENQSKCPQLEKMSTLQLERGLFIGTVCGLMKTTIFLAKSNA